MRWRVKPGEPLYIRAIGMVAAVLVAPFVLCAVAGVAGYKAKVYVLGPKWDWMPWRAWRPVYAWDINEMIWLEKIFRRRRYQRTEYSSMATPDVIDPEAG